tara:strand:+ start:3152 stop:3730 length:579 start_codon:yes stop_codon:yes gene_type:complete
MKKFIQFFLFFVIIIISIFFYKNYFETKKDLAQKDFVLEGDDSLENKNNLIKNLKYDVQFNDNSQYIIIAESSELMYEESVETVYMSMVTAIIVDENNSKITVTADTAVFNNSTYNTNFEKNVKIVYFDNIINSQKLDLNFTENIVTIYENVVYEGLQGNMKADNVIINLITKNMEIFMNNPKNKIEITKKN